ncbi:MAG TPA: glycerol-3-phosphate dehydrogenase [Allosphingosinicella sp.]|nr:glycerol-3-phosphate dehydrogenase [Allosphingosinicella sp.]
MRMDSFDLLVVGGGINGAAIARDAAGRGLAVLLVEKDDLAAHTSSASSKLIHGGLRYLEQYEFALVRESLHERAVLLRTAPHLVRPLRFVLPDPPGGRPFWLLRLGLFVYDLLSARDELPRSRRIRRPDPALKAAFRLASYYDAWVDDSRLVVLNALDAAERGAEIATRTLFLSARRDGDAWTAGLAGGRTVRAGTIVNAAGPWVADVLNERLGARSASRVRLVKGSHILVPRLWEGDHAYLLQQPDGRVVFALPYGDKSLIGTTDAAVERPADAVIGADEIAYLCAAANAYFVKAIAPADVIWSYSGVRSLYDDGAARAKDVTRDFHLELDGAAGPKLISVFGGKVTTARALATEALDALGVGGFKFTATSPLPGGDIDRAFNDRLHALAAWLPPPLLARLAAAYGTRLETLLGGAGSLADLGRHFGAGLYEREVRYLVDTEFARTADDIIWRRSKLGLAMSEEEQAALADWLSAALRS